MRQRRGGPPGGSGGAPNAVSGLLLQALQHHRAGDLAGAAASCQRVLECAPEQPDALHLLGVLHHQSGDHRKAAELIGRSIRRNPRNAEAHSNLGAALSGAGDLDGAAKSFQRAIKLDPRSAGAYANLAALSVRRGTDKDAIRNFRAAHRLSPGEPRFIRRLAELYLKHEQFEEAVEWFGRYLSLAPDDAEAHNNAAFALQRLDRLEDAEAHYRRAMALDPDKPEFGNNLAGVLQRQGRAAEADALFSRVLEMDPLRWEDLSHYAGALFNNGCIEKALALYESLTLESPSNAALHRDFGVALCQSGRNDDAKAALRRALNLDASLDGARIELARCLLRDREIEPAVAALQAIPRESDSYLTACLDLCLIFAGTDRLDEACAFAREAARHSHFRASMFVKPYTVFRKACAFEDIEALPGCMAEVNDHSLSTWANVFLELLVAADTEEGISELAALHRRWGDKIMKSVGANPLPPTGPARGGPRIRLGFVSSDLRKHSVARFVMPLFENYDRERFEIYCYSPTLDETDEVQRRIRGHVAEFRVIGHMPYRESAATIRDDKIDILFELNGFTADSRLTVMAYRPAPVQIYWLGYPFTTGLRAMDYLLMDDDIVPANTAWLTEKPLSIRGSWICYEPFEATMPAREPPIIRNGHITFGTLNNPYKFTRAAIANWARVMSAVPGSRFLFVHPEYSSRTVVDNLVREFDRCEIVPDRLDFVDNGRKEISHFAFYDEIDVSLDTAPLTGGTTTTDALWMGVPVVTLAGPGLHQRLSRGVLAKVGLGDLCAGSPDAFVATAVSLARDIGRLTQLRQDLRARMQASRLCQPREFCRSFETLMLELVERHGLRG